MVTYPGYLKRANRIERQRDANKAVIEACPSSGNLFSVRRLLMDNPEERLQQLEGFEGVYGDIRVDAHDETVGI